MSEKPTYEELEDRIRELEQTAADHNRMELARSEALFRGLFDNMTSGSAIYEVINDGSKGSDYIIRGFNKKSLELEGRTLDQVIGKSLFDLRPAIDDYGLIGILQKVWKTGIPAHYPVNIYQDERFSNYYENYVFKIPSGEVVTIYSDITDQKNNELALKLGKERIELATRAGNFGIWDWDIQKNKIFWDDRMYALYGIKKSDFRNVYDAWLNALHPDDRAENDRISELARRGEEEYDTEFRVVWPDRTIRFIKSLGQVIWDSEGNPLRMTGVNYDITERKQAEEALRESEAFLKTLIDAIPNPIFFKDKHGKYLGFNKAFEEFFGETKERLTGKSVFEINPPELAKIYEARDNELFKSGGVQHYESQWKNAHGELRDMIFNKSVFTDNKAAVTGLIGVLIDITDRKQAEWQYQMLFQEMFNGFALHEIILDAEGQPANYRFLAVNPAFEKMTGLKGDQIVGRTVLDVLPGIERHWVEIYGKVALSGQPAFFESYSADLGKHFQVTAFRSAPGRFASIFVDINERKTTEFALRESEEKFRNFTEQSFVGFYIIQDGLLRYVNPKFADIFGYTIDECLDGMHFRQLVHPEDFAIVQEKVRTRVAGEIGVVQYTFRGIKKTGEIIYVAIYGSSLIYKERPAAIGTVLDITKELEMEKRVAQSQRMEAIGNLAGGIAHDFNNLLFPIIGMSELLLEDLPRNSPEYENVQEILKAGMRGSDLVKQILSFSRQSEHQLIPVRPQQVLEEVIKLIRSTIPSFIDIEQDIQPDCGLLMADPTQIHQVAMNILTNAFHAVEEKGGKITVKLKEVALEADAGAEGMPGPGRYALLSISDTGYGISPDVMNKIFEPYFTTKEQGKGTGLGLAVAYGIVKKLEGEIKVFSEAGKGTTFKVYLPLMETPSDTVTVQKTKSDLGGNERILLVDDEESIVRLEKLQLERLGYHVTERASSTDALKAFQSNPTAFDLVISDMTMPNMTGDQLAKKLILARPDIPVIICTGFSARIDQKKAKAIGVKGFLMKPVVRSEMAKMVRKVLDEVKDGIHE